MSRISFGFRRLRRKTGPFFQPFVAMADSSLGTHPNCLFPQCGRSLTGTSGEWLDVEFDTGRKAFFIVIDLRCWQDAAALILKRFLDSKAVLRAFRRAGLPYPISETRATTLS